MVETILAEGGRAEFFAVDLVDSESIETTSEVVFKHFGRLDILVNAAGITLAQGMNASLADRIKAWDLLDGMKHRRGMRFDRNPVLRPERVKIIHHQSPGLNI